MEINLPLGQPKESCTPYKQMRHPFSIQNFQNFMASNKWYIVIKIRGGGGLNFCRKFISSVSLILELAGSNLVQTLLNNPQVLWTRFQNVTDWSIRADCQSSKHCMVA